MRIWEPEFGHTMAAETASPKDHNSTLKQSRLSDSAHALCKRRDIGKHARHQLGRGLSLGVEACLHAIDYGRADHGGIGMARDGGGLLGRLDAEAHADR